MTVLLKYCDGVHAYDDMASAIAKQDEIGGELFVPVDGELLAIAIEARAELSNYTSDHFGGRNHSAISVIADLDAIIAKAGNGGRA